MGHAGQKLPFHSSRLAKLLVGVLQLFDLLPNLLPGLAQLVQHAVGTFREYSEFVPIANRHVSDVFRRLSGKDIINHSSHQSYGTRDRHVDQDGREYSPRP